MKLTKLLILLLLLSLEGFTQKPSYTLKYDKAEFCAGSNGFSNPIIINNVNKEILTGPILRHSFFSFSKISGNGILKIDEALQRSWHGSMLCPT